MCKGALSGQKVGEVTLHKHSLFELTICILKDANDFPQQFSSPDHFLKTA